MPKRYKRFGAMMNYIATLDTCAVPIKAQLRYKHELSYPQGWSSMVRQYFLTYLWLNEDHNKWAMKKGKVVTIWQYGISQYYQVHMWVYSIIGIFQMDVSEFAKWTMNGYIILLEQCMWTRRFSDRTPRIRTSHFVLSYKCDPEQ